MIILTPQGPVTVVIKPGKKGSPATLEPQVTKGRVIFATGWEIKVLPTVGHPEIEVPLHFVEADTYRKLPIEKKTQLWMRYYDNVVVNEVALLVDGTEVAVDAFTKRHNSGNPRLRQS